MLSAFPHSSPARDPTAFVPLDVAPEPKQDHPGIESTRFRQSLRPRRAWGSRRRGSAIR